MAEQLAYLGTAYEHPRNLTETANAKRVSGLPNIEQAIHELLDTPIGTRFYFESWGSNLFQLTFMPNDAVLESLIRHHVVEAISTWEKRVRIISVEFKGIDDAQMDVLITYRIVASNEINSLIYPFYSEIKR